MSLAASMKRPAAIKLEPPTPKKRGRPAEAPTPRPAEAPTPKPAEAEPAKPAGAEPAKPAKASASKTEKKPLAPPSKAAWNDLKYQCQTLAKKGKTHLQKAWQEAQSQGQMAKREFYYNIFLLDPDVAHKQVHKESLQRHTEESTVEKGWMTKWKIGKLEGADPSLPNFESLCDLAVKGLAERSHENEAWAEAGVKQYYFEKEISHLEKLSHESLTKATQKVGGEALTDQDFERVEASLQVTGPPQRMLLGSASGSGRGASKKSLEEAYAEHLEKCKQLEDECNKALGKLESLTEAFKLEKDKNPSPQLQASNTELESLQESFKKKKEGFEQRVLVYPGKAEAPVNDADVKKLEELKKEMETELKSLKKAVAPHKMWASNNKINVK